MNKVEVVFVPDGRPNWYKCPNCGHSFYIEVLRRNLLDPNRVYCRLNYHGYDHFPR